MNAKEEGTRADVIIEVVSRRIAHGGKSPKQTAREAVQLVAYDAVYEDEKDSNNKAFEVMDSPAMKFVGFLFNPSTLVLVLYLSSIGWSKVLWLQKFLSVFGRGTLVKRPGQAEVKELPFQTFECEKCKMEMRPARGRAEVIFGRERFRCSRCGSKASAYFNIEDMSDPRAVARLERLENEKLAENAEVDDEEEEGAEGGDEEEEEEEDEKPPPLPRKRR